MKKVITTKYISPCGEMILGSLDGKLCLCDWLQSKHSRAIYNRFGRLVRAEILAGEDEVLDLAARQLDEYFEGERKEFTVPIIQIGTDFHKVVWNEVMKIPYGQTTTYAQLAAQTGRPGAVRSVANAVGTNALSIIIPCHRVIGSDGSMTGYAGGLHAKSYLIHLEQGLRIGPESV